MLAQGISFLWNRKRRELLVERGLHEHRTSSDGSPRFRSLDRVVEFRRRVERGFDNDNRILADDIFEVILIVEHVSIVEVVVFLFDIEELLRRLELLHRCRLFSARHHGCQLLLVLEIQHIQAARAEFIQNGIRVVLAGLHFVYCHSLFQYCTLCPLSTPHEHLVE